MAIFHLLAAGYVGDRTASTVSLVKSDDAPVIVIDPGMVASTSRILEPLRGLGVDPSEVTDIVISHHHPDHTMNIALFPKARVHDHWAIYEDDLWISREAEGHQIGRDVTLWETPGHTPQDLTTLVSVGSDTVAFTHLWWFEGGPDEDPYATDSSSLHQNRERVLDIATLIVPAHGSPFVPGPETPR